MYSMAQAHWCEDSLPLYKVCCAAPEGYLSTAMVATSTGVQLSCNLELEPGLELERLQLRDESTASQV